MASEIQDIKITRYHLSAFQDWDILNSFLLRLKLISTNTIISFTFVRVISEILALNSAPQMGHRNEQLDILAELLKNK